MIHYRVPLPCGNQRVDLGPSWVTIGARPDVPSDHDVIQEVFIEDIYSLRGLDTHGWDHPDDGVTVIDLGANIGAFTLAALQLHAGRVIAVEPEPENFAVLRENVQAHPRGSRAVTLIQAAVAGQAGKVAVAGRGAQAHTGDGTDVEAVTLEALLAGQRGRIGFLKIDIEGAEYEAVRACPTGQLARCERIVAEWHGPDEAPHLDAWPVGALVEQLLATHTVNVYGNPRAGGFLRAERYGQ